MKIAIIGSGIAGLTCAHLLDPDHDVTVFEAGDRVGGHTNTVDVVIPDRSGQLHSVAVDTGFIVFNEGNYPHFITLLDRLGVASQHSEMSFSVMSASTGLEYRGTNLNTLYAQRLWKGWLKVSAQRSNASELFCPQPALIDSTHDVDR